MSSVVKVEFNTMKITDLIPDRDESECFERAMKVFLTAFIGYDQINGRLYDRKKREFVQKMKQLFDVMVPKDHTIQDIMTEINDNEYNLSITVVKFEDTGANQWVNPKLMVTWSDKDKPSVKPLTRRPDGHTHCEVVVSMNVNDVISFRVQNKTIIIKLGNVKNFQEFRINARKISVEGFEDWVQVGPKVRLLLKIEFKVYMEPIHEEIQNLFHYTFLKLMVNKRLELMRATRHTDIGVEHRQSANKVKVSYIRPQVDVNTQEAYWPHQPYKSIEELVATFDDNTTEEDRDKAIKNQILRKSVRYCDLQIGFKPWHQLDDSCCLCSEWCNWNAFFHFNPIYRFLMIGHNQWFLENRTTVPDIYLLAAVEVTKSNSTTGQKTPINSLIYCANDYRKRVANEIMLKNKVFNQYYYDNTPKPLYLTGFAYRSLRQGICLKVLRLQLHPNGLSSVCIEDIQNYFNVMTDLHHKMAIDNYFIEIDDLKKWTQELSYVLCNHLVTYIKPVYRQLLTDKTFSINDYIFSSDNEYSSRLATNKDEEKILNLRRSVTKFSVFDNSLNLRVSTNDLLSVFISLYNVFTRLGFSVHGIRSYKKYETTFTDIDKDFDAEDQKYDRNGDKLRWFGFQFDRLLSGNQLKQLVTFYTLKLYYYMFGVQRKSIEATIDAVGYTTKGQKQICCDYTFLWIGDVEVTYSQYFPNDNLFGIHDSTTIEDSVERFYKHLWGKAYHQYPGITTLDEFAESAYREYRRLYFWSKQSGNQWKRFDNILQSFADSFINCRDSSQLILKTQICDAISELFVANKKGNCIEIMDHLVYYLVKAICSVCLTICATLLSNVFNVNEVWSTKKTSPAVPMTRAVNYPLTKPGWIEILNTRCQVVNEFIADINELYIDYDDEFNRIGNTLNQTRHCVKHMYKHIYNRLCDEWLEELNTMNTNAITFAYMYELQCLHVSYGLTFLGAFMDEYRIDFNLMRKRLLEVVLKDPGHPQNNYNQSFQDCLPLCRNYLRDPIAVREAQPFGGQHWTPILQAVYDELDQLQPQDVGIDMNEVNRN